MFFNILIFIFGVSVGWYIHIYFNYIQPPKKIFIEKNITKVRVVSRECKEKIVIRENKIIEPTFEDILNSNFQKALDLYINSNEQKREIYRDKIKSFFLNSKVDILTANRLEQFIEIESDSQELYLILVKIYVQLKEFDRAIEILFELKGYMDIDNFLENILDEYINRLKSSNRFEKLETLLEKILDEDINTPKYRFLLAKNYIELKRYQEAKEILENTSRYSKYYSEAKSLSKDIDKISEMKKEYNYQTPIYKLGELYTVEAEINGVYTKLLIDTGASITLINSSFLTYYNMEDNLILNTVAGIVEAKTAYINLKIANLELSDFRVSTTNIDIQTEDGINGVLGMDFLKNFDFKIDQKNSLLLLSPIE